MPDAYPRSVKVGGALARSAGVGSDASRARVNGRCILYDWFRPRAQTGDRIFICVVSCELHLHIRTLAACTVGLSPLAGRSGRRAVRDASSLHVRVRTHVTSRGPSDGRRATETAHCSPSSSARLPCGDWCSVFRFPVGRRVLLPTCTPATGTRSGCGVCDARMSDFVSTRTARSVPANGRIWLYRVCAGRDEVAEGPT